jgi:hypothetical protein
MEEVANNSSWENRKKTSFVGAKKIDNTNFDFNFYSL